MLTRRNWMAATAALGAAPPQASAAVRNFVISSSNGLRACTKAMEMLKSGGDTLDAAIAGVNINEEDPEDDSVGYGGLPNEEGIVELDACVMHGPTRRAGSVASVRNIKYPSRLAKLVMEQTDHVMLAGEGALRFARAYGIKDRICSLSVRVWPGSCGSAACAMPVATIIGPTAWMRRPRKPKPNEAPVPRCRRCFARLCLGPRGSSGDRHHQLPHPQRQGRDERRDDDERLGLEDPRPDSPYHRSRLVCGSGRGWRRIHGPRRGEHPCLWGAFLDGKTCATAWLPRTLASMC